MQNRIVEIASNDAFLNLERGFMKVKRKSCEGGKVALDDMAALIVRGYGSTLSVNLCAALAERNIPVVICGHNQSPASIVWPVAGHFQQGLHMQAQAQANKPLLKRLWAQLVASKLKHQAFVLSHCSAGVVSPKLKQLAKQVKAGDSENREAQGARLYWPALMGENFKRDRSQLGVNAVLNYGYSILRSATARSILSAGLHPSLSVHHQSAGDALRLADDLMEPFRPFVDLHVWQLWQQQDKAEVFELEKDIKLALTNILSLDLEGEQGASPLQHCLDRLAQSLARVFMGERQNLLLPGKPVFQPLFSAAL